MMGDTDVDRLRDAEMRGGSGFISRVLSVPGAASPALDGEKVGTHPMVNGERAGFYRRSSYPDRFFVVKPDRDVFPPFFAGSSPRTFFSIAL